MSIDHCYLGSLYAEQNDLPVSTQAAIRYHHEIEEAADHRKVISLVAAADHMANYLQRCQDPRAYDLNLNPGFEFMARNWSGARKDSVARSIPTILIETVDAASAARRPEKDPCQRVRGATQTVGVSTASPAAISFEKRQVDVRHVRVCPPAAKRSSQRSPHFRSEWELPFLPRFLMLGLRSRQPLGSLRDEVLRGIDLLHADNSLRKLIPGDLLQVLHPIQMQLGRRDPVLRLVTDSGQSGVTTARRDHV